MLKYIYAMFVCVLYLFLNVCMHQQNVIYFFHYVLLFLTCLSSCVHFSSTFFPILHSKIHSHFGYVNVLCYRIMYFLLVFEPHVRLCDHW